MVLSAVIAVVCAGVTGFALLGPIMVVRNVKIDGSTEPIPMKLRQLISTQTADQRGIPLARIDANALTAGLRALPEIRDVQVARAWPSTLHVIVTPRVAVAVAPQGDNFRLVDSDGVVFDAVSRPPSGLPVVDVVSDSAHSDELAAAVEVVMSLPASIRREVREVEVDSSGGVRFRWQRAEVIWGSVAQTPLKAEVLQVLPESKVYDLTSPMTPVVR
ncbi:MAG: cell division protein FtsQ/DivIB [Actinomycetota bacterium]